MLLLCAHFGGLGAAGCWKEIYERGMLRLNIGIAD